MSSQRTFEEFQKLFIPPDEKPNFCNMELFIYLMAITLNSGCDDLWLAEETGDFTAEGQGIVTFKNLKQVADYIGVTEDEIYDRGISDAMYVPDVKVIEITDDLFLYPTPDQQEWFLAEQEKRNT